MKTSRRMFLGGVAGSLGAGWWPQGAGAQQRPAAAPPATADLLLVNGRIHTMDAANRVVPQVLIRNGRFAAVGSGGDTRGARRIDLRGRSRRQSLYSPSL